MNKLAEKIISVMNDEELEALIDDHYRGEAQTLTTGAEQNLLKLKELRGLLTPEEDERWTEIKKTFQRNKGAGGDEDDPVMKITSTLAGMSQRVESLGDVLKDAAKGQGTHAALSSFAQALGEQQQQTQAALTAIGSALKKDKGEDESAGLSAIAKAISKNEVAPALEKLSAALGQGSNDALAEGLAKLGEGFGKVRIDVAVPEPEGLRQLLDMQRALFERLAAQPNAIASAPSSVKIDDAPAFDEILLGIAKVQNTLDEAEERRKSYRPFQAVGVRREEDE